MKGFLNHSSHRQQQPARFLWLDSMRGMAILWIVFFHFFSAYDSGRYPWPLNLTALPGFVAQHNPASWLAALSCLAEGLLAALLQRGPQAVGVFLAISGFAITRARLRTPADRQGWAQWYRHRLVRLLPLYWTAHLVYLVSPMVLRKDPLDMRFLLSLLGDRFWPVETMFYYLNPSWWFVGLLLQLYIVFPLLYRVLEKLRPLKFLIICGSLTLLSRFILLAVLHAHGNYIQGAFCGARLWEFSAGMALALQHHKSPREVEHRLFSKPGMLCGCCLYALGGYSYRPGLSYLATDALIGTGLFILMAGAARAITGIAFIRTVIALTGTYSYGIYLLHHPYVLYWGQRLQGAGMASFLIQGGVVVAIICCAAIVIERFVNLLTNILIYRKH
jgi:peptidoglycan/LPS O-acetylase OafA/YrhL